MDTEKVESKNENPKKDAGFINKLFFGWMISLMRKRREINLELHDFYDVFDEDDSKVLGNRLQKNWKSEIVKSQQSKRKPSLLKAIVKTFLFEVMFYGIFCFFSNVLIRCTQPLILARLISLFGEEFNEKNAEKMYFYSTMLIVTSILTAFMSNHIELGLSAIGMRIRIACSSLLYRKVIRLDYKSLEVAAVDRVVDLLSNDVNRFDFVIKPIHSFWTIPVQILVLTYFVWEQVGFSCLAGVATMIIITFTLQGYVSKLMGNLRSKISQRTDERVKLMTEIISGIQLIKINGWEKRFESLVDCARKKEMIAITAASYLRGAVSSCFVFLEKTALALTIICYVGSGHRITAEKVFSIAQAYGILHTSLSVLLPEAMTRRSETSTSVERLRDFLLLDEKPHGAIEPMIKTGIIVTEVDASWSNQTNILTDLSVQIPRGCLCAVTGPTGAGKSSLLHLLLGELPAKSGRIQLGGHVSYCSQEAWLSNSTVRGNITFGNPYDDRCYDKIVKVCDLGVDFERLPRGDRTVCDEPGVSLSGGQRAKIHLARAVYKQADIYLLDDPLSAVDARAGKLLFEECILKYLKGKTRILVTRQLEHLKAADFVVVLNEGKIEATGTFRELCKSKIDFTEMLVKKSAKSEKYEKPTDIEVTTNFPSNKNFISKSKNKYYHGKSRLKPYNGEDVVNNGGVNRADIVKNKKDVVKHVEDVVNNGNIVKYKADIVKHENDVVKQKEDVVKHIEDVVNNGNMVKYKADIVKHENDVVKQKEDVVKHIEDVVNNGNMVKYKADMVKHENDVVKQKEDVVKQKEDVVNNGNIVKYKTDIVKHENNVVKQKEDVVNNGNIVKYKADIVKHENDVVKQKEDVVKVKEDVVNNGNIVKYKADIVKHENDVVKQKEDVVKVKEDVVNNGNMVEDKADIVKQKIDVVNNSNMVKYKAEMVKHREDIVKGKEDVVKQKEDIVKQTGDVINNGNMVKCKADIVKHKNDILKQKEVVANNGNVAKDKADIVKHKEDIVKHKNDIVKQKEVVVNNSNMIEDKADIEKVKEDIVKREEDVENSNDIWEDKADKVKYKEDIVKNNENMANNGEVVKDKADVVKYEDDVVEDKEDIVKNNENMTNNGNIIKDKADVVKYEEDIVEDKEDIVKNKEDMTNNGNIVKDNNDIVNNDGDGILNDYNKNKGKNYLLKKYVLAAKRVEIAIVTLLLFLLTQILSSGVDLWVTFWTSQEELRHQNTSITLNVSSSMSRYHPEEYAVRVFYVNGKHSMGKYGYSYQETIPVLKTIAPRASDGVFDTVEINGVAHDLVKTNLAAILYALLMIMVIVLTLVRSWLFFKVCMMSSVNMHKEMFDSLMEAPLEFFDTDSGGKTIGESSKDTGSTKEVRSKVSMTPQQTTFSNSSKPDSFSKETGSFNGVLSKVSMGSQQTPFSNSSKPDSFSKETGSFNGVLSKVSMGSQQTPFSNSSKPDSFSKETGSFNGVLSKVSMGSQQTPFSNSSKPDSFSKETGSFNGVLSKVSMGSQQTPFSNSSKPDSFSKESGSFNGVLSKVLMGSQQTTFSNSSKPDSFSKESGSFNGVLSKVSMGSQQTTFSNSSKPDNFSKESGSFNGVLSKVSMGSQQTTFSNSSKPDNFSKESGSFNGVLSKVSMGSQQTTFSNSSKPDNFSKETGSFNGVLSKVSMGSQQTTFSNSSKPDSFSKETGSFNGVLSKVSMGSQQTTFSNSSKPDSFSKETGSFNGVLSKVSMGSQQTTFSNSSKPDNFSKETGSFNGVLSKVSMGSQQTTFSNSSKPNSFSKETGSFNGVLSKVSMGSQQTTFSNSSKPDNFSKETGSFNGVLSKVSMGSQQTTFSNSSKPDSFSKETGSFNGVLSKVSMGSQQTTFSNSSKPDSFSKETGSFNGVLSKVSMGSQQTTFSNSSKPDNFSKETGSFNGVLSKVSMGSQQTTFSNSSKPDNFSKETGSFNGVLSKVSMGSQQTTFSNSSKPNSFSKETGSFNGVLSKVSMGSQQTTFSNSSKPDNFSKETGSFNGVLSKVSMGSQQTTFSNSSKPDSFSKETGSFNGVLSKVSMGSQQTTFSNSSKPNSFSKETGSFNGVLSKVSMGSQQTPFSNSSKPDSFSKETGSFNGVLSKVSMGSQQITNKSEEILNRFSKDTGSVDEVLPRVLMDSIQVMLTLGGIFVNLLYSNPYYIVAMLLLGTVFVKFGNLYTSTAEIFKRLENKTKYPMISHITSSINGIVTIRASKAESMLTDKFDVHQNLHTSASYLKISSASAFGLWLDLICVVQLTVIILSFLILHKYTDVNGSLVGLAISQSMILGAALRYGLKRTAETKNRLTSVEKVLQYTEIKNEKPSETQKEFFPPESWPGRGKIEFRNIFLKRSDDDLGVLRNINFTILPGEKIGIVGRTGAGKTSLISVLFRLVRFDGSVLIDDVDTKQIGRELIRKKISIIPREPILFSSTIRYNLDPYNEYNDEEMWKALEQVELSNCVSSLDLKVSEDGSNFSLGQKQLIYLARALLRNNKILILDEATANVDHRTDALIQATIRNRFKNCTVITIAHRLNTIMEYNKVMVMSDGKFVEIGHPHQLLDNNKGHFHKLVLETGPEMSSKLKEVAMMTYYEDYTHCFYIK